MSRPSTLSPARLAKVHALGRKGVCQRLIGEAVGLTQSRVSQLLEGRGVRAKSQEGIERDQAIRRERRMKVPVPKLARKYRLTRARVYQILSED